MHTLDRYINDIEPRILSICKGIPSQEEPSLQEALAAYGWVLLDSWIAWRTLRFLLRETCIDDKVQEKWFQTPSSYTASQLKAAWLFNDVLINYIEENTGKKFKELIDKTIQVNRNSSAHFSKKSNINGSDYHTISQYFKTLSTAFLFYETSSFLDKVCEILQSKGYSSFQISIDEQSRIAATAFKEHIDDYSHATRFSLWCSPKSGDELGIIFAKDGCSTYRRIPDGNPIVHDVVNDKNSFYNFFMNKGFYLEVGLFVDTVIYNWDSICDAPEQHSQEFAFSV